MRHIISNWKTTLAGVAAIIGSILTYHSNPAGAITGITAGLGLIGAKDCNRDADY